MDFKLLIFLTPILFVCCNLSQKHINNQNPCYNEFYSIDSGMVGLTVTIDSVFDQPNEFLVDFALLTPKNYDTVALVCDSIDKILLSNVNEKRNYEIIGKTNRFYFIKHTLFEEVYTEIYDVIDGELVYRVYGTNVIFNDSIIVCFTHYLDTKGGFWVLDATSKELRIIEDYRYLNWFCVALKVENNGQIIMCRNFFNCDKWNTLRTENVTISLIRVC